LKTSEVINLLGLTPLTVEGGYFSETFRSTAGARRGDTERSAGTCIYYLLDPLSVSAWHKVASDEIWLYQAGVPARQLLLFDNGSWEERIIGPDLGKGERPQSVIPAGTWQAAVLDERSHVNLPSTGDQTSGCPEWSSSQMERLRFAPGNAEHQLGPASFSPAKCGRSTCEPSGVLGDTDVWGLFSAVVIPGFEYDDFQVGAAAELARCWPAAASLILDRYSFPANNSIRSTVELLARKT
jgi:predicted cupin superfamily sugar epimerase